MTHREKLEYCRIPHTSSSVTRYHTHKLLYTARTYTADTLVVIQNCLIRRGKAACLAGLDSLRREDEGCEEEGRRCNQVALERGGFRDGSFDSASGGQR